jgi:hypothetical protein
MGITFEVSNLGFTTARRVFFFVLFATNTSALSATGQGRVLGHSLKYERMSCGHNARLSVRPSVTHYDRLDFSSNFHEIYYRVFLWKFLYRARVLWKLAHWHWHWHPRFQVSRKPSVISTNALNALNATQYRSILNIDRAKSLTSLESLYEVLSVLTYFSSDCSWTSVTKRAQKNLGAILNFVEVAQLKPHLTQWSQQFLPTLSLLLSCWGGSRYNRSAHDAVKRWWVSVQSSWAKPFFSCVCKYSDL